MSYEQRPKPGILHLSITDILDWMILSWVDYPVHSKRFSRIPSLYSLDAIIPPHPQNDDNQKVFPDITKYLLGVQNLEPLASQERLSHFPW